MAYLSSLRRDQRKTLLVPFHLTTTLPALSLYPGQPDAIHNPILTGFCQHIHELISSSWNYCVFAEIHWTCHPPPSSLAMKAPTSPFDQRDSRSAQQKGVDKHVVHLMITRRRCWAL